jgi:hypothetical protein
MNRLYPAISILASVALIAAILLAARQPPNEAWANSVFSASLLMLGLAATGAIFLQGRKRAYWAGFALFGWMYLVLVMGPWFEVKIAPLLITETAFKALEQRFGPYGIENGAVDGLVDQVKYTPRLVGHALSALLAGLLGGAVAFGFAGRRADSNLRTTAEANGPQPSLRTH